jgi:hypothetical protein
MTIREMRCPRCGIRRTINFGHWGSMCLNSRLHWGTQASVEVAPTAAARVHHPFTPAELVRLERYRAAIQAGFYTDYFTQQDEAALQSRARLSPHSLTRPHRSGSTGLHASGPAQAALEMANPSGQI